MMVPLDGSAFAERALPLAVDIARRASANLQIVHELLCKRCAGVHDRYFRCADLVVKQVMSSDVFFVPVDTSLSKVIETFVTRETRRLFVIDQDEVLVGEIRIFDLLRTIGEHVNPRRFSRRRP